MPKQRTLTPLVEVDPEIEKLTKENGYLSEKLEKVRRGNIRGDGKKQKFPNNLDRT